MFPNVLGSIYYFTVSNQRLNIYKTRQIVFLVFLLIIVIYDNFYYYF